MRDFYWLHRSRRRLNDTIEYSGYVLRNLRRQCLLYLLREDGRIISAGEVRSDIQKLVTSM